VADEAETAAWWARLHPVDGSNVVGEAMPGADALMQQALFLGVYPGLNAAMLQRMKRIV